MLIFLYPLALILALLALSLWFYFDGRERITSWLKGLLSGSVLLYLLSLLGSGLSGEALWVTLVRDLILLGLIPSLLKYFKGDKRVFFFSLLLTLVVVAWYESRQAEQALARMTEQRQEPAVGDVPTEGDTKEDNREADAGEQADWEYLVDISEGVSPDALQRLAKAYGLQWQKAFDMQHPERTDLDEYYLLDLPGEQAGDSEKAKEISALLLEEGLADWIEENERVQVGPIEAKLPAPRRRDYGIDDPELQRLWSFDLMHVNELYRFLRLLPLKPRKTALIAILDTGVDAKHEDLNGQYRSTKPAYDRDVREHGTHCAGIAAAVSNNGIGIASFAPSTGYVEVTSIKVLNDYGTGRQSRIVQGILEAADLGADVISLSLGGPSSPSKQRAYEDAVAYARKAGAIVVVAAGNDNRNAKGYAPANVRGVITVSAVDTLGNKASFSNTVQDLPQAVAAPGVAIFSTTPGDHYKAFSGTSMATPYVAGLIALMKSYKPDLSADEAYRILYQTGKDTPAGKRTGRLIQPAACMRALLKQ